MVTEPISAALPAWDQPAWPAFWTNDLQTARASLLRLARDAGLPLPTLIRAADWVEECHRGQYRKGTDAPYAVHPIRLTCGLIESCDVTDVEVLTAALLHDVLEDTQTTAETIERDYGKRCADLVTVLSRGAGEHRPAGGDSVDSPYLQRIRQTGDAAIVIKLADKIDNLRDAINHPDKNRAGVFVDETFPAYVPLARSLAEPWLATRMERLLLEAAGRTGGVRNPPFLKALLAMVARCLETGGDLSEVPFPAVAATLYSFFYPEAQAWLEFDGVTLARVHLQARDLAARIASSLRRQLGGPELSRLLELAGIPPAFAAPSNDALWRRAEAQLARLQKLLLAGNVPNWLTTLLRPEHQPLLLALVQSSIDLPASWRCPLWSTDLGAVLSDRMREISGTPASALPAFALSHRLALSRHADGSGTRTRASRVFEHDAVRHFSAEGLWALRIGMESLQSERGSDALDALWAEVHDKEFAESSLPESPRLIAAASVETIGLRETEALFADVDAGQQFANLLHVLTRQAHAPATWIVFDHEEWRKRRPRWSQPGQLRIEAHVETDVDIDDLESRGARVIQRRFGSTELITVLPARTFALQDRLPEIASADLESIARRRYTAAAMFDTMISGVAETLWTPRVYRVLDTIEDLDPDGVQSLTVDYESSGEAIPSLHSVLPLPADEDEARGQPGRKRLLARYVAAQIYSCGLVRRVRRVSISCSAVAEPRREHAFSDSELRDALTAAENEHGLRAAFGPYIERYGFDPFGVTTARPDTAASFGADEMRQGVYVGVDIGGQRVKIAVARSGALLDNPVRREIPTPSGLTVAQFCRQILGHVTRELEDVSVRWDQVGGIGISWPGAVRNNRIAGMSRVLEGLNEDGRRFSPAEPIDRLGSFDLLAAFAGELRKTPPDGKSGLQEDLALSLVNDGDAEAFGHHALRTLKGLSKPGGKIFIKLGTSLAGGRITAAGVVAEDVAEYSKIVVSLPSRETRVPWPHLARYYVSAEGVRHLSRTFSFGGSLLFGLRDGANRDDNPFRIEPVELGQLLPLFVDGNADVPFLTDLVQTDNRGTRERMESAIASTAAALRGVNRQALVDTIRQRGMDLGREFPGWTTGVRRMLWLCTGSSEDGAYVDGVIPESFPFDALAHTIVGTVALFSQLGLHVAHLIAQLYNIYRRGTFSEVVLAGGVLGGRSGEIVESQAKGFLRKYYDKIYGEGKPLGPGTLVRAGFEGVSNPGVFGAAMAASRQWHVERDRLLSRRIEEHLRLLPLGQEVSIEELLGAADDPSSHTRALHLLERHFATGEIARTPDGRIQKVS